MGKQPHACARLVLGAAVAAACVCTRASAQIAPSVNYLPNVLLDRWPAMPLVERLDFILSKRERQAYLKEFRKFDKDGDGLLSRAEITRRAKASGINEFDGDTRVSDMVDKFMKEGDGKRRPTQGGGNDDGQLDFEEFLVARGWCAPCLFGCWKVTRTLPPRLRCSFVVSSFVRRWIIRQGGGGSGGGGGGSGEAGREADEAETAEEEASVAQAKRARAAARACLGITLAAARCHAPVATWTPRAPRRVVAPSGRRRDSGRRAGSTAT